MTRITLWKLGLIGLLVIIVGFLVVVVNARPQSVLPPSPIPLLISYRGQIADGMGPVNGSRDLAFRVYDQPTGGTLLWQEQHTGIQVRAGEFTTLLGATQTPSGTLPLNLFQDPERWLEIVVSGIPLQPRQQFTSVPYAFQAQHATTAQTATVALHTQGGGGLPAGAMVWFALDSVPEGFHLKPAALGQDMGVWTEIPAMPEAITTVSCDIWTGSVILCWNSAVAATAQGVTYDPGSQSWTPITASNPPSPRGQASRVWTGTDLIIWGGSASGTALDTGARYTLATNTWTPMSSVNAPSPRAAHQAIWTGQRMIVWGGLDSANQALTSGAAYDPVTNTWTPIADALFARRDGTPVWTGQDVIVLNGYDADGSPVAPERYRPATNTWSSIALPSYEVSHVGVPTWTGSEVMFDDTTDLHFYAPATSQWRRHTKPTSFSGFLSGGRQAAVFANGRLLATGAGIYDLADRQWLALYAALGNEQIAAVNLMTTSDSLMAFFARRGFFHTPDIMMPYVKE